MSRNKKKCDKNDITQATWPIPIGFQNPYRITKSMDTFIDKQVLKA